MFGIGKVFSNDFERIYSTKLHSFDQKYSKKQQNYRSLQCHMILQKYSNMLICCSRNISDYYQCWKQWRCFMLVEMMIQLFQDKKIKILTPNIWTVLYVSIAAEQRHFICPDWLFSLLLQTFIVLNKGKSHLPLQCHICALHIQSVSLHQKNRHTNPSPFISFHCLLEEPSLCVHCLENYRDLICLQPCIWFVFTNLHRYQTLKTQACLETQPHWCLF